MSTYTLVDCFLEYIQDCYNKANKLPKGNRAIQVLLSDADRALNIIKYANHFTMHDIVNMVCDWDTAPREVFFEIAKTHGFQQEIENTGLIRYAY